MACSTAVVLLYYTTVVIRALISGPASVAGTATGDPRPAAHVRWASPPEGPPGGSPEAFFFAIYALIYARKQATKCA